MISNSICPFCFLRAWLCYCNRPILTDEDEKRWEQREQKREERIDIAMREIWE